MEPIAEAEALRDGRLVVWSPSDGSRLFRLGYYGKPLGIPKPKDEFEAPLVLDLIEGVYLLERGLVRVYSGEDRSPIELGELIERARRTMKGFEEKYLVYRDLRERGLIATPGIKYGCDFAVYRYGPGIDHAPYIVQVKGSEEEISADEIVRAGRLATTVRKTFIIAVVDDGKVRYLGFKWWKP